MASWLHADEGWLTAMPADEVQIGDTVCYASGKFYRLIIVQDIGAGRKLVGFRTSRKRPFAMRRLRAVVEHKEILLVGDGPGTAP